MHANISLPQGFTSRPARLDDAEMTVRLINAFSNHYYHMEEANLNNFLRDWQTPGHNLKTDTKLVFSPEGKLVGYQDVFSTHTPPVHPWVWGCVHPQFENLGIGTYLLTWAETRARQEVPKVPDGLRVSLLAGIDERALPAKQLLLNFGFRPTRQSYKMLLEMSDAPPKPKFPPHIQLKPYDPERDAAAVYRADDDAFRDHFGFIEEPFEEGFQKFTHHFTQDEAYDPSLWFIAWDGDEIAGICLCKKWAEDDKDAGYISSLGVRRPWRHQGLGSALLYQAFNEFYKRGKRKVALEVDAESLTGAVDLYLKVGMKVARRFTRYEKELRPGKEIIVQSLEDAS